MSDPVSREARNVGAVIAAKRQEQNYSQEDFAECLGISRNALGSIERGQSEMKVGALISACDALGVSPNEVLPARLSRENTGYPELNQIADQLDSLKPWQRQQFFDTMNLVLAGIKATKK
ncbi:MAG: helix-turn-helix transcriptional regulator [Oscillospiraceae bacterium]|nr:helix-turn-helix transcriptional regulator [Oscillospiraceae bacterium]